MSLWGKSVLLPDGVRYVSYIEATGSQWINTGYFYREDSRLTAELWVSASAGAVSWPGVFGTRTANLRSNSWLFVPVHATYGRNACYTRGGSYSGENVGVPMPTETRLTLECENGGVRWFGEGVTPVSHTVSYDAGGGVYPLFLFGINMVGAIQNSTCCRMKLYGCRIQEGDELVRDLRPALDGAGVPCLYDRVTKEYAYNAGSGSFLYG